MNDSPSDPEGTSTNGASKSSHPSSRHHQVSSHAAVVERLVSQSPLHSRFEVRDEVARGGMGAILRVWDADLRRQLAMKVMLGPRGREGGRQESPRAPVETTDLYRFLDEAQVTGQLDHPGIVPVHELGIDAQGSVFFTMPLVRGADFGKVLRTLHGDPQPNVEGDWTLSGAIGVVLRVCEAVAYAHSKGVIHRDLKPANVMVGRFGEVYVMDWGLARVQGREDPHDLRLRAEDLDLATRIRTERSLAREHTPESPLETLDGTVIGTPSYMSPEQALGRIRDLGPRSDVYAIGAMLYQVLCGRMPYVEPDHKTSPHTILARLIDGPPVPLYELVPEVPEDLVAICDKAMSHDPEDRYESAFELARDLRAWTEHRPVGAQTASTGYLLRLFLERNRAAAGIAGLAAMMLVTLVGIWIASLSEQVGKTREALDMVNSERVAKDRVAGIHAARSLVDEVGDLDLTPAGLHDLDVWLARVDGLLPQAEGYRALLDGLPDAHPDRRELERTLASIETLRAERGRVEGYRTVAAGLRARSIDDEQAAWRRARADISRMEVYGGLDLEPQEGLVPLERNEWSGLWEFWHVASGERPEPDASGDGWRMREEDGLVLVLLPGGDFTMGTLDGEDGEPAHPETVGPYFLGRTEVTQAQYARIEGHNPSLWSIGPVPKFGNTVDAEEPDITGLHPVETIDWYDAVRFCRRLDLRLPREAEWEFACRATTESPYFWGDDPMSLEGMESVNDRSAAEHGMPPHAPWDDGFPLHAPVASFEPNGFGLFDMHGNVTEWCSDRVDPSSVRNPDGSRRAARGGNWLLRLELNRVAFRQWGHPQELTPGRGMRVARSVQAREEP